MYKSEASNREPIIVSPSKPTIMEKILYSIVALVCLSAAAVAQGPKPLLSRPPGMFPPHPTPACYGAKLQQDLTPDLNFVCNDNNDMTTYPKEEIDTALRYAEDRWKIYSTLSQECFREKPNFFMNLHEEPDFYNAKCVCKTKRTQLYSVYNEDGLKCYVVFPNQQKIHFAECGGTCNLGYSGVTGYHCIPRGYTYRRFLAYCQYPKNLPANASLKCLDPLQGYLNPLELPPSPLMTDEFTKSGFMYERTGFFTEINQTMPTYCGCRGYFCGF